MARDLPSLQVALQQMKKSERDSVKCDLERARDMKRRVRESYAKRLAIKRAEFEGVYWAYQALLGAGFEPKLDIWYSSASLHLDCSGVKELARVRAALGVKLTVSGEKELVEKSRSKVWVSLKPDGYSCIYIRYQTKLSPEDKCKIVCKSVTTRERSLQCSID